MDELKPCPFCGGAAHFDHDDDGWNWIECAGCGASTNARVSAMDDCKPLLAEQWNSRVTPGVKPAADLIDCEGASPCSTCPDKRECGRSGCVGIAQRRNAMKADAGSAAIGGVRGTSEHPAADALRWAGFGPDDNAAAGVALPRDDQSKGGA